uniref:Uncharacterized protein n=1 Tax=Timema douglasi TaxID=61478 RepID=A0A7R8W1H1_TIMDO|nr:unnamed protein product [Timema douglasi]
MAEASAAFIQAVTNLKSTKLEDPYTMCINESLKRVPINQKNRCIIEVLEVIDKYLEK